MSAMRTRAIVAARLAARRRGVTAPELAEEAGCPPVTARRTLALLARDGVLVAEVPARKGKQRGDWRTVYRVVKGG